MSGHRGTRPRLGQFLICIPTGKGVILINRFIFSGDINNRACGILAIGYIDSICSRSAPIPLIFQFILRGLDGFLGPSTGQGHIVINDVDGLARFLSPIHPAIESIFEAALFNRRLRGRQNRCALSRDICSGIFIILIFRSRTRNFISHSVGGHHGFRRITQHGLKRRSFLVRVAAQASLIGDCIIGDISVFTSPPCCALRIRLDGNGNNQFGTAVGNFVSLCGLCNCIGRIVKVGHFQLLPIDLDFGLEGFGLLPFISASRCISASRFIHAIHFSGLYSDFRSISRSHAVKREIIGQCIGKDCLFIGLDFQLGNFLNDLLEHIVEGSTILCRQVVIGCRALEILCDFPRLTTNQPIAGFFNTDFGCTFEIAGQEIQETVCGCNIKPANRLTVTSKPCIRVCIAPIFANIAVTGIVLYNSK